MAPLLGRLAHAQHLRGGARAAGPGWLMSLAYLDPGNLDYRPTCRWAPTPAPGWSTAHGQVQGTVGAATTAERRSLCFNQTQDGGERNWAGPSWPRQTARVLSGRANFLVDHPRVQSVFLCRSVF